MFVLILFYLVSSQLTATVFSYVNHLFLLIVVLHFVVWLKMCFMADIHTRCPLVSESRHTSLWLYQTVHVIGKCVLMNKQVVVRQLCRDGGESDTQTFETMLQRSFCHYLNFTLFCYFIVSLPVWLDLNITTTWSSLGKTVSWVC